MDSGLSVPFMSMCLCPRALTSTPPQNPKEVIRMQLPDAQTILQAWAIAYARTLPTGYQHGASGRSVPREVHCHGVCHDGPVKLRSACIQQSSSVSYPVTEVYFYQQGQAAAQRHDADFISVEKRI